MTTAMHASKASDSTATLRHTAAGISLLIAVLYGLIWSGVLDVVPGAEPGELGILGVAGFELWGISIRVVQVALIGVLIALLARSRCDRRQGP